MNHKGKTAPGPSLKAYLVTFTRNNEATAEINWRLETVQVTHLKEHTKEFITENGVNIRTVHELTSNLTIDRFRQVQEKIGSRLTKANPTMGVYLVRLYGSKSYQGMYEHTGRLSLGRTSTFTKLEGETPIQMLFSLN